MDPNVGTEAELMKFVETAHAHGIRVVMDVIMNHCGPVTETDPVWPDEWVRTSPQCTYRDYESTVTCTLVKNLPDIRTESDEAVDLPPQLLQKWEQEGRLEQELAELDAFFERTGYPRAPRYYLIKWLTDYVRKYGIDGYRLDTAKHIEESIWGELGKEAQAAFKEWKKANPDKVLDEQDFFMVGEVYGYGISGGRDFSFGDREVDFFDHGIHSLINFEFKASANMSYEKLFSSYSEKLHNELQGAGILNYLSSHDDGGPFDKDRKRVLEAGSKLLLCPGASQVYYGDESSRKLNIPGTHGDATLRSNMNWKEIASNEVRNGVAVGEVLEHYRKLGRFRRDHPAVGAGVHQMISKNPYIFSRICEEDGLNDRIVAGLELKPGKQSLDVSSVFADGTPLMDYYSGEELVVKKGKVELDTEFETVLLGRK
jgi:alpha-amylase